MAKQEISRRTFIKGLAAGAASIAALGVLEGVEAAVSGKGTAAAAAGSAGNAGSAASEAAAVTEAAVAASDLPEEVKSEVVQAVSGMTFTPGTYTASEKGMQSDCVVTMTFDEHSITDVQIDVSGETPDIGAAAGGKLQDAILSGQTADIDAVTGATVTSNAVKKAAADCISQASGQQVELTAKEETGADWLGEAPEIADGDITEELDVEVLVAGLGTGGWPTLMTAAEEGLKVLAIEKNEALTTIREDIGAIGSKWQKETEKKFPEMAIDKMEAIEDIVRYATGYCKFDLIRFWADNSAETVEWLGDILESSGKYYMEHEGGIGDTRYHERDKAYATGHSPHKTEKYADDQDVTLNSVFLEHLAEYPNAEIRNNCALVKLIQDESGAVIGAIAQDRTDEHYIRINTSKGVVMATGGYLCNTAMMNALQPMTQQMKVQCRIGSKGDGSGIKAMLWAGAQMDPIHTSMMFNRCCVLPTETAGYETTGEWFWIGEQPFLKVNLLGERFCNESGPYEFMLHAMEMQPYHTYCDIFDANNEKYTEQFQEVGCCRLWPFDNGAKQNMPYVAAWGSVEGLIEKGYVQKADTLEELAEKLNIPVDTFVATVKRYNELCKKGVDEDYGKAQHRLTPIDTAPYYGVRTAAWHLTTLDGVGINTDMQVLGEDGKPIEGLYATGDCSGGFFANNYPNLFTGLACGRTMTFGRHAAKVLAMK